jgi:hypothetical protein
MVTQWSHTFMESCICALQEIKRSVWMPWQIFEQGQLHPIRISVGHVPWNLPCVLRDVSDMDLHPFHRPHFVTNVVFMDAGSV